LMVGLVNSLLMPPTHVSPIRSTTIGLNSTNFFWLWKRQSYFENRIFQVELRLLNHRLYQNKRQGLGFSAYRNPNSFGITHSDFCWMKKSNFEKVETRIPTFIRGVKNETLVRLP
jgi:hypothetical protein